ncbi:MAG: hypothetical protein E7571_00305 [Ruminococcaceae bacterium]|nr:hypothetical protein [Oscillospiraceae bacterium]
MKDFNNSLAGYIAKNQYRYYYTTLSVKMQNAYSILLDGYLKHKRDIKVNVGNIEDAWLVHRALCYDVPELFFIKSIKAAFNPVNTTVTVYPEYRFDYETCISIIKNMEQQTKPLIKKISMFSEQEKVKAIHDYIVETVTYKDLDAPYSHEAPGAILYGIAVCEGISKAFKFLADRANINSIVLIGEAVDGGTYRTANESGHAWNIAVINSVSYHIDVTFDYSLSKGKTIRYDYYLLSDNQIQNDHKFKPTFNCRCDYEHYISNGHYADSRKKLQHLVKNELKVGGKPLVIKVPNVFESEKQASELLLQIVVSAIPMSYKLKSTVSLSYNWMRMIYQIELSC